MAKKRARKEVGHSAPLKPKNRHAAAMGRKGARSTNAKLTPEQRSAAARRASRARWARRDAAKVTPPGSPSPSPRPES